MQRTDGPDQAEQRERVRADRGDHVVRPSRACSTPGEMDDLEAQPRPQELVVLADDQAGGPRPQPPAGLHDVAREDRVRHDRGLGQRAAELEQAARHVVAGGDQPQRAVAVAADPGGGLAGVAGGVAGAMAGVDPVDQLRAGATGGVQHGAGVHVRDERRRRTPAAPAPGSAATRRSPAARCRRSARRWRPSASPGRRPPSGWRRRSASARSPRRVETTRAPRITAGSTARRRRRTLRKVICDVRTLPSRGHWQPAAPAPEPAPAFPRHDFVPDGVAEFFAASCASRAVARQHLHPTAQANRYDLLHRRRAPIRMHSVT